MSQKKWCSTAVAVSGQLEFSYDLAFDRNLGLVTDWEQIALRAKRVAIAGLGGVGGVHLLTLARLGIGCFTIADFDKFDLVNFNRQVGAMMSTIGRDKAAVLEEMALQINPELRIRRFGEGVTDETVDDFLRDADLFVDGLDFFALPIRRHVFARCADLGIPAVTAAPIGMGTAFIAFDPKGMSFEQYFRFDGQPEPEQHLRFLLGLTPRGFHRHYIVDPTRIDLARRRGPSTVVAAQLCAGVVGAAAVKLLLKRGTVMPAPCNHQYDAYVGRHAVSRLRFGNAGPLQQLKLAVGRRLYRGLQPASAPAEPSATPRTTIEEILNLARWAPAGDNAQPWTFQIVDDETALVHIRHDPANVYEYRHGEPTWLSAGMLLETMRIAATVWQRGMLCEPGSPEAPASMTARFPLTEGLAVDPLASFVSLRSVDRCAYSRRPLSAAEKTTLETCLGGRLRIDWHEGLRSRWRMARLSALATAIRLRCPEAFAIHRRLIDWDNAQSPAGIPARALGLSRSTLRLMGWGMRRWQRTRWINRFGGALAAAGQMDYLPGVFSAAYFVLRRPPPSTGKAASVAELLEMGRAIQSFWLTATRLGLAMQPALATLAFAHYGTNRMTFSSEPGLSGRAERLARDFGVTLEVDPNEVIFLGRIGEPNQRLPTHRSVRLPLADLMTSGPPPSEA
jgi:molybdopterin/thiamine biosynthesis adenylyltransferase/nitroreductase